MIRFKQKLLNTLDILKNIPEIIIIGSEIPNIIYLSENIDELNLFVSQDIDIGIPVELADKIIERLTNLLEFYFKSNDEPSVLIPKSVEYLEINFLGIDKKLKNLDDVYIFENKNLSFMVFGNLSLIERQEILLAGTKFFIAEPVSLIFEKLLSERNYIKLERDLYVAALLLNNINFTEQRNRIITIFNKFDNERKLLILDNLIFLQSIICKNAKNSINNNKVKELIRVLKYECGI